MDKKALLSELRIDRTEETSSSGKPIKWFLAIAVVAGLGFVGLYVGFPTEAATEPLRTVVARAMAAAPAGGSVLDATGYVVARRQATVSAKVTGKVLEVLIEEGMTVEAGQLLAQLDDSIPRAQLALSASQLAAARASLDEMRVQVRQAELDLSRTQGLAERNLASRADLDRDTLSVEALNARLARAGEELNVAERAMAVQSQMVSDMQIRAPFAGVVIAKDAQPGEMISPISAGGGFTRTGICTIVDMGSLEVEVDVNEAYINRVYPGQPATIALNAYPDEPMPAKVIATIPAADRNKATVRVRIAFVERDERVLPDMGVKVAFLTEAAARLTEAGALNPAAAPGGVLVPGTAIANDAGDPHVWVVDDARVYRRPVEIGPARGSRVLIVAGLAGGERILASLPDVPVEALSEGARVAVLQ